MPALAPNDRLSTHDALSCDAGVGQEPRARARLARETPCRTPVSTPPPSFSAGPSSQEADGVLLRLYLSTSPRKKAEMWSWDRVRPLWSGLLEEAALGRAAASHETSRVSMERG